MARRRPDPIRWPSWRYGPHGESGIFQSEVDVPHGWTRKPGELFVPVESTAIDRQQVINDLEAKGITIKGNWSVAYMKELLDS